MDQQGKSDWEISKLYQEAWEIIKKHKLLWIFGMAIAGYSSSSNINLNSSDLESLQKNLSQNFEPLQPNSSINQMINQSESFSNLTNSLQPLFSTIPFEFYLILGLELILLIIFFWLITLITNSWATASLLHSIQTAINKKTPTMQDSSHKAFKAIKPLLWLSIIPSLVLFLSFTLGMTLLIFLMNIDNQLITLISVFGIIITIGAFVYYLIYLTLSQIWATRLVVIENYPAKQALLAGYAISKKKFWSMLLLGLINTIITTFIIGMPVAFIIAFFLGGLLTFSTLPIIGTTLAAIGGSLVLIFFLGYLLLSGILTAFKATIWSLAYKNIKGKYVK